MRSARRGGLLAAPRADPFAEELVLVSARGMERWLSQRLSHVLGVCAGVLIISDVQHCGAASACFTDFGLSGIRGGGGRLAGGDSHLAHGDLIWDHVSPPRGMAVIPRRVEQYWN